jgi:hypothetical protein
MRQVLIIAFGLVSLGALASVQPAFAVQKQVCNTTLFAGETTRQMAKCKTIGGCTTTYPINGFAAKKTCYWIDVQPGAPSVTGMTSSPSTRYHAN